MQVAPLFGSYTEAGNEERVEMIRAIFSISCRHLPDAMVSTSAGNNHRPMQREEIPWFFARNYTRNRFGLPTNVQFLNVAGRLEYTVDLNAYHKIIEWVRLVDEARRLLWHGYLAKEIVIIVSSTAAVGVMKRLTGHMLDPQMQQYSEYTMPQIYKMGDFVNRKAEVVLFGIEVGEGLNIIQSNTYQLSAVKSANNLLIVVGNIPRLEGATNANDNVCPTLISKLHQAGWINNVTVQLSPGIKELYPEIF